MDRVYFARKLAPGKWELVLSFWYAASAMCSEERVEQRLGLYQSRSRALCVARLLAGRSGVVSD